MPVFDIKLPQPPTALIDAVNILQRFNDEITHRIEVHRETFRIFWYPTDGTTPDEIIEQMGNRAGMFYALSQESIRDIITGLTIAGLNPDDYFPPVCYTPPREILVNPDGTATIAPIPSPPPDATIYVDNAETGEELRVDDVSV